MVKYYAEPKAANDQVAASDVLACLPFAVITLNQDQTIAFINTAAVDLFGYTEAELLGKPLQMLIEQNNKPSAPELVSNQTIDISTLGIRKDATRFAAELTLAPLNNSDMRKTVAVVRNIEEQLERENRYRLLVETSEVPQFVMDQTTFIYANKAAAKLYGYDSVDDLTDLHPSEISPQFQPDGQDSESKSAEMVGLAYDKGWHRFDWVNIKRDGSEVLMDIILTRMPHMGADALFCACHDITQRRKSEEYLRRTQKMEALGLLTGGIAHDFNNLLGIIIGNLELMQNSLDEDASAQGHINAAMVAAFRGAEITSKLLRFTNEKVREVRRIGVNDTIKEFEMLISKSLTAAISIKLNLADDTWPVDVDPGDFGDVILNLALNARDAMPQGGLLTIETANKTLDADYVKHNTGASVGDFVMISIGDNGTGMTEQVKERIFEPFFTTKKEGRSTGLGMSMVYGFITQSGGHLNIYSEPSKGSTFSIYFPRADLAEKIE